MPANGGCNLARARCHMTDYSLITSGTQFMVIADAALAGICHRVSFLQPFVRTALGEGCCCCWEVVGLVTTHVPPHAMLWPGDVAESRTFAPSRTAVPRTPVSPRTTAPRSSFCPQDTCPPDVRPLLTVARRASPRSSSGGRCPGGECPGSECSNTGVATAALSRTPSITLTDVNVHRIMCCRQRCYCCCCYCC